MAGPALGKAWGGPPCLYLMDFNAIVDEFKSGEQKKLFDAEHLQRRAAKATGTRRAIKTGEVSYQVRPEFFHYWGKRLGYECWDDHDGFVREFLRDNPECRVVSHTDKVQVGRGSLDKKNGQHYRRPIVGTKFRKVYGKAA